MADVSGSDSEDGEPTDRRSAQIALGVFAVLVLAAFPVIMALGSYHWFLRDEWSFLAGRDLTSVDDLFRPHARTHWSTLPVIAYRLLWNIVGVRSYLPYQACVVALHLAIVVLLRVVMRRAGVGPWMATVAAAPFVLFGPGTQNILWAFQIGFTGAMVLGLTQLLLSSHDGGLDRRDALGLFAGVLALMSSGVGVTMAIAVGVAVLLRRGWRIALFHTLPLAVIYGTWALIEHPRTTTPGFGYPSIGTIGEWLRSTVTGTLTALARFDVLAILLAIMLVVGLVLAWNRGQGGFRRERVALPAGLLVGCLAFSMSTVLGRWPYGTDFGRASRYLYIAVALVLPAVAVAADAISTRWKVVTPVVMALLLVPIPFNLDGFRDDTLFGRRYFDSEERLLRTAIRMPFAREVPRDVRPIPDTYHSSVTIGFLLDARRDGKLRPSSGPVSRLETNELRVRLGVAQRFVPAETVRCREVDKPLVIRPSRGTTYRFRTPVDVTLLGRNGRASSERVAFLPSDGDHLTIELDGLTLRVTPRRGSRSFTWCDTD